MARRTKAQAEATREAILDAAEAEFLEQGVSRTTLERIARRAGLTRGAIYWHFKDKADLLVALRDRIDRPVWEWLADRDRHVDEDPLRTLHERCCLALHRLDDEATYRNVHAIFMTRCELVGEAAAVFASRARLEEEILARLTGDFARAAALGLLKPGRAPRVAALTLWSLMGGVFLSWLRAPERFDLKTEGEAMLELFFTGLAD